MKSTKITSWNVSLSTIVGQKNPNIRESKQIGSSKKNIKNIHMPLNRVSCKGNLYSPCQAQKKPCAVYISRSVSYSCDSMEFWGLGHVVFEFISAIAFKKNTS